MEFFVVVSIVLYVGGKRQVLSIEYAMHSHSRSKRQTIQIMLQSSRFGHFRASCPHSTMKKSLNTDISDQPQQFPFQKEMGGNTHYLVNILEIVSLHCPNAIIKQVNPFPHKDAF